ncbi:MAG: AsmA-like C-terminal region-containing protein [Kiritimatiellia bacterium]
MAFKLLRKIKYALFIVFIFFLVALFYLSSIGLPRAVVHKIEPYLQFSGMVLNLDKIKLSVFEGIVATSVRYYKIGDVGAPIIQAEKFVLKIEPLAWISGGNGISGAYVKKGRLQFSPTGDAEGKLLLDDIFADVHFGQNSRLEVLSLSTTCENIRISGKGEIVLPSEKTVAREKNDRATTNAPPISVEDPELRQMTLFLKNFACSNAVNIELDFYIEPADMKKLYVKADVHGRNTSHAGLSIGGWSASVIVKGGSASGSLQLKEAAMETVSFQSLDALVRYDGKNCLTAKLHGVVSGAGVRAGPAALELKYDFASDRFEGQATTECDLRAFAPLLQSRKLKLGDIFAAFDFKRSLPSGSLEFSGALKPSFECRLSGSVLTDTLAYGSVPCLLVKVGFDALLTEDGEKVTILPILVVRDEGMARGHMIYDSDGNTISFSAMSTADPAAMAAMIDPVVVSALAPFAFEGLCNVNACGKVGLSNSEPNDAEITFNAGKVRWKMLQFAPCNLTLQIEKDSYRIDDFFGSIFHGNIRGVASLDPLAGTSNTVYALSAKANNIDFGVLINSLAGKRIESAYEGTCSADFELQGVIEDETLASMRGGGWVKIDNGRIFTVPLFSGLFDILGKAIPGIGTFNGKNNAHASLTIANGRVRGRNVYIDGDVFSLKGSGDIYLDGRLDFKVQITFMRRQSLIGNLVQIITLPITKALEIHLGGTVSDPKWELSHLPW